MMAGNILFIINSLVEKYVPPVFFAASSLLILWFFWPFLFDVRLENIPSILLLSLIILCILGYWLISYPLLQFIYQNKKQKYQKKKEREKETQIIEEYLQQMLAEEKSILAHCLEFDIKRFLYQKMPYSHYAGLKNKNIIIDSGYGDPSYCIPSDVWEILQGSKAEICRNFIFDEDHPFVEQNRKAIMDSMIKTPFLMKKHLGDVSENQRL